ncbi:MAG: hypothetical protein ACYCS0_06790 [bacterium]
MPAITPITFKQEEIKKVFCPVLMKESDCEEALEIPCQSDFLLVNL